VLLLDVRLPALHCIGAGKHRFAAPKRARHAVYDETVHRHVMPGWKKRGKAISA
jgi:hypothetical protein